MLEVEIGAQLYNFCTEADAKRITHAEASLSDAAKSARALQKSTRKDEEDKNLAIEGQIFKSAAVVLRAAEPCKQTIPREDGCGTAILFFFAVKKLDNKV
ncbi:unnamed protein product [Arctia plantaginis]|uniref:Uncharacterized protein n=1 Tax=Arctia plantaginis TaxID=874455 RepID=A0A8S0ZE70_ARCPL|nr:unnamed protein product [Arctia plantaginis]